MRKLQNTLYITTQGSYLHKERETLVIEQTVEQERKKVAQLPVHAIGHIFLFRQRAGVAVFNGFLR